MKTQTRIPVVKCELHQSYHSADYPCIGCLVEKIEGRQVGVEECSRIERVAAFRNRRQV